MIPKIDFALDQQPHEPLPAPVFTALCPGSPCAVCGAIEDAGGVTATPRTRGLCAAHFKAETQITLKAETGANAHLCAAYVATLPTGERVELPAGTVLREGAGAIDHRHLLACARGVVDHDAAQALTGPVAHALLSALRVACGDSIEDVAQRAGPLEPMSPAWINAQFREVTQAEGEAILADLTERAGLPREMAPSAEVPDEHGYLDGYPSTESPPANLDPTERETPPPIPFAEAHETRAERAARLRDAMGSPVEADPDPIAALTLAAQEDAARKAAHLGRPTYDRARGRISFGPVEVVEAPDLEAGPPKPRT